VNFIVSAAAAECLGAISVRDDALPFVHCHTAEPFKSSEITPELFHQVSEREQIFSLNIFQVI